MEEKQSICLNCGKNLLDVDLKLINIENTEYLIECSCGELIKETDISESVINKLYWS